MKKIILSAFILAVATLGAQAQDQPAEKREPRGRHHNEAFQQLNLSEEQKAKFKTINEDYRKQMKALKSNEDITVKESKAKMEGLRNNHRASIQSLLTAEQKTKLEKMKQDHKGMKHERKGHHARGGRDRIESLKTRLNLTEDQSARLEKSRAESREKFKALKEDKSLSDEQRKERMKELRDKQKQSLKSILTEEQLKKMNEKQAKKPAKQSV